MRSLAFAVAATLSLFACGPQPLPIMPVVVVPDAGSTEVPDAGSPCDGVQPCRISWSSGPAYPADVDHHSTFVATSSAGTFLYVAGGADNQTQGIYDTVRRAPIAADGSLGAWVDCTKLPQPNAFQSFAQSGRHVYLLSGISQDMTGIFGHDFVFEGTVQDDGDIAWVKSGNRLRAAFMHGTGAVIGKTLFAMGGLGTMSTPQSLVKYAPINDDGTLGAWVAGVSLPVQRSHHVAVVKDGQIFLVGGFDVGNFPLGDVLRSDFDANGTLAGWSKVGSIDSSPWTAAGVVYQGYLFVLGGGEGGPGSEHYVDRVRRASITGDMTVSAFEDVDKLPEARSHVHQAPIFGDHIYSVGGRHGVLQESFGDVYIGKLGGGPSM